MRRGGVQYLGRSGVEVWRIQALARHSSSAILGYLEGAHISTLNTVAAEAATGRTLEAVRRELAALQAEVAAGAKPPGAVPQALGPAATTPATDLQVPVSVENILESAPQAPARQASVDYPYVVSALSRGKLHRKHPQINGLTLCGWAWQRHASAFEIAETFAAPGCRKCKPPGVEEPPPAAVSRSSSSSSASTSSSSPE